MQETIQAQVSARAMKDASFRQALLSNPRAVLAREYQVHLPAHITVRVLEDTANTFTLVLSTREPVMMELTEADLQAVNGGGGQPGGVVLEHESGDAHLQ
jgi:hypothetical protein